MPTNHDHTEGAAPHRTFSLKGPALALVLAFSSVSLIRACATVDFLVNKNTVTQHSASLVHRGDRPLIYLHSDISAQDGRRMTPLCIATESPTGDGKLTTDGSLRALVDALPDLAKNGTWSALGDLSPNSFNPNRCDALVEDYNGQIDRNTAALQKEVIDRTDTMTEAFYKGRSLDSLIQDIPDNTALVSPVTSDATEIILGGEGNGTIFSARLGVPSQSDNGKNAAFTYFSWQKKDGTFSSLLLTNKAITLTEQFVREGKLYTIEHALPLGLDEVLAAATLDRQTPPNGLLTSYPASGTVTPYWTRENMLVLANLVLAQKEQLAFRMLGPTDTLMPYPKARSDLQDIVSTLTAQLAGSKPWGP